MTEQIQPIDSSKERVALELMNIISNHEFEHSEDNYLSPTPRDYYLSLYADCLKTVRKAMHKES